MTKMNKNILYVPKQATMYIQHRTIANKPGKFTKNVLPIETGSPSSLCALLRDILLRYQLCRETGVLNDLIDVKSEL